MSFAQMLQAKSVEYLENILLNALQIKTMAETLNTGMKSVGQ